MGLTFNLHSGAALKTMMDDVADTTAKILKKAFHGYSSDIVSQAQQLGAKSVAENPLNDLATAPLNAIPKIESIKAGVTFSSSNWTGRNFDGFTKPKVEASVDIGNANAPKRDEKIMSPNF